jgi:hypothetical protein
MLSHATITIAAILVGGAHHQGQRTSWSQRKEGIQCAIIVARSKTVLIAFAPATFIAKVDPSRGAPTAEDSMWPLQAAMTSPMTMKMMMPKVRQHLPPA